MLEILGAICGTSIWYALMCWILRVRKNKRFVLAGIITWLVCAILYGLFNDYYGSFLLMFFVGIFKYFWGCLLWTGLALYLDKKNKNIKWVLLYIPISALLLAILGIGAIATTSTALTQQKRHAVHDDVAQIVTGVRMLLGEYDDYSHINNATIFGAIGMSATNPYGGHYMLEAYSDDPKMFILSITGINQRDCKYFVETEWQDSVLYKIDSKKFSGAIAIPENCSASSNVIQILYN